MDDLGDTLPCYRPIYQFKLNIDVEVQRCEKCDNYILLIGYAFVYITVKW